MSSIYKRKGGKYFIYSTRYKSKRIRISTKMSNRKLAKKVQEFWDLKLIKGELDFLGNRNVISASLKDYFLHYRKFIETRKSVNTCLICRGILRQFSAYLKKQKITVLNEIDISVMDGYIDWLKCAPKTKKNHISALSQLFDQAIKENIIASNSARLATLPQMTSVRKHRAYSREDLNIIFRDAGSWRLYYLYLLHTGLRAGDVGTLTYGNIDRRRKIITHFIRKSRKIYEFPLSEALLAATPDGTLSDALFPSLLVQKELLNGDCIVDEKRLHSALSKPRKYLQAILEAAGRPKGTLHSFRVTYNNSLRDIGVSIQDRKVLLAHSSVSTTEIYTLPNLELARSYVNQLPIPGEKFELNGG